MTFRILGRRRFPAVLFVSTMLLLGPVVSASASGGSTGYSPVPKRICRIDWRGSQWRVKRLIRCAAHRWHVPGGASKALSIADRESHFLPRAYNASSGAAGIYQHLRRYWPGRARAFGFRDRSAFNARANVIVTIRMVHRLGNWSPWGG